MILLATIPVLTLDLAIVVLLIIGVLVCATFFVLRRIWTSTRSQSPKLWILKLIVVGLTSGGMCSGCAVSLLFGEVASLVLFYLLLTLI